MQVIHAHYGWQDWDGEGQNIIINDRCTRGPHSSLSSLIQYPAGGKNPASGRLTTADQFILDYLSGELPEHVRI
jgi:hypothetical protein